MCLDKHEVPALDVREACSYCKRAQRSCLYPSDTLCFAMKALTCSGLFRLVFRARKLRRLFVPFMVDWLLPSFSICVNMFKIVGSVGSFSGVERI